MHEFQDLMRQFLDTQKSVMHAFLQGYADGPALAREPQLGVASQSLGHTVEQPLLRMQPSEVDVAGMAQAMTFPVLQGSPTPQDGMISPQEGIYTPALQAQTSSLELSARQESASVSLVPVTDLPLADIPAIPDREELAARLVAIVSERTGYPPDMLNLDLDLEADLGIDSIKRIEILGNYQKSFNFTADQDIAVIMEELAKIKTLRGVIEWVDTRLRHVVAGQSVPVEMQTPGPELLDAEAWEESTPLMLPEAAPKLNPPTEEQAGEDVRRFTLRSVEIPVPEARSLATLSPGRVVMVTDDGGGVGQCLCEALRAQGHRVALVGLETDPQAVELGVYGADLTAYSEVVEVLDLIRQRQGRVGALIHLLPLGDRLSAQASDKAEAYEPLRGAIKSLFNLAKAMSQDLKSAGQQGGACILAVTGLGGTFGSVASDGQRPVMAGHGGVAGLVKTLAREWPGVRAKVLDTTASEPATVLVAKILQELQASDGEVEVGYAGERRLALRPTLSVLDAGATPALSIDPSWVMLITGGARGITAEVARELSERYQPTLLIVGRTPPPPLEESPDTQGLHEPRELKAALMELMRDAGEAITPARVEAAYHQLLKEREIRDNLRAMERAGATVRYAPVDVCDEQAFGDLIEGIYRDYGRLDGVIHGAGIIEDKFIEDKTPESFDRVFDTKVRSALVLSRKLKLDELSCLVFFSSLSGRFGNRGQCDYAAANEVLNKLALSLDRRCPGRVVSINWGPWESGMVSPELRQQFSQHGVVIVPRDIGRKMLDQELCFGRKGEVEILLGGIADGRGPTSPAPKVPQPRELRSYPLIGIGTSGLQVADGSLEMLCTLDPARDLYLNDHQLDGKPVFPLTMAMELMAEVASAGWPDLHVVAVRQLRLLRGLVLEDGPLPVRIIATPLTVPDHDGVEVEVSIVGAAPRGPAHYKAIVALAPSLPIPPVIEPLSLTETITLPLSRDDVYRRWLFHGPLMAAVASITEVGANGIIGDLIPSSPEKCLVEAPQASWIIDPIVLDSALQLIIVWSRIHWDMTPLPSRLHTYRRFGPLSGRKITCQMRIIPDPSGHIVHCYPAFFGEDGRLFGLVDDAEGVCSKALNRLASAQDNLE
jgi:NAD(P)-dependent dehydrogenase (short-subunit alcohol dehydrogenase family)/acyl carrier protein